MPKSESERLKELMELCLLKERERIIQEKIKEKVIVNPK
jgi:hypothetical protein